MGDRSRRSLVRAVSRASAAVLGTIALAVVAAAVSALLLLRGHAESTDLIDAARESRRAHESMLARQHVIDEFLLTADRSLLAEEDQLAVDHDEAVLALEGLVSGDTTVVPLMIETRVAVTRWADHSDTVARGFRMVGNELYQFVREDKELWEGYDAAYQRLGDRLVAERDDVVADQRVLLLVSGGFQLGLLVLAGVLAFRQRRMLQVGVVGPVGEIGSTVARMRAGELGARVPDGGFDEIAEVGVGLARLGETLADEQARAALRSDLIAAQADRLRELLRLSREVSGRQDIPFVLESVRGAGQRLTGWTRVEVHLVDDAPLPAELAEIASSGHPRIETGRCAFPMVVGGTVVGVLECLAPGRELADDVGEALAVLAAQAATAVDAARMHERLQQESRLDALTGLGNRRVFDEDLSAEVARGQRYDRPLSVVMLDLDQFKAVNDTFGHQRGDAVLQDVAGVIGRRLRTSDTAYRYGGEEFVLLLRETELEEAVVVAERLRELLARRGAGGLDLTASFGVVQVHPRETAASVVSRADAALYDAKAAGRNRVVADRHPDFVLD